MQNVSMKSMLEAGVHFGHQTRRWNPKMARYIFGERNKIHIIDLQKTVKELKKAYNYVKDQAFEGATFLFVGTKKQAQEVIKAESERAGVAYVHLKWLGGTLTNWQTRYQVTREADLSSADNAVMIAGVYLGGFDTDNYGFIQDLGMVLVLFAGTFTASPGVIGSRVYVADSTGIDQGLGDVRTADATSLLNAQYLGVAVTLPVIDTRHAVLLNFNNALGMVP